jgi:hypothetical protein
MQFAAQIFFFLIVSFVGVFVLLLLVNIREDEKENIHLALSLQSEELLIQNPHMGLWREGNAIG